MIKRIRKWWLCRKFHICPVHGELLDDVGGYEGGWVCRACIVDNEGKSIHRNQTNHLARVGAQERLHKDWRLPLGTYFPGPTYTKADFPTKPSTSAASSGVSDLQESESV